MNHAICLLYFIQIANKLGLNKNVCGECSIAYSRDLQVLWRPLGQEEAGDRKVKWGIRILNFDVSNGRVEQRSCTAYCETKTVTAD
jgi:hypothetical protein